MAGFGTCRQVVAGGGRCWNDIPPDDVMPRVLPGRGFTRCSRRAPKVLLAAYAGLLIASAPFTGRVAVGLARMPWGGLVLAVVPVVAVCALVGTVARGQGRAQLRHYPGSWLSIVGLYAATWYLLCQRPVEGMHLAQYGALSCLAFWAFEDTRLPWKGFVLGWALTVAVSWTNEVVQSILPDRVYDLRDVMLDGIGGVLGLLVLWQLRRPLA